VVQWVLNAQAWVLEVLVVLVVYGAMASTAQLAMVGCTEVVAGVLPEIGALGLEGIPGPSGEPPEKYGGSPPWLESTSWSFSGWTTTISWGFGE